MEKSEFGGVFLRLNMVSMASRRGLAWLLLVRVKSKLRFSVLGIRAFQGRSTEKSVQENHSKYLGGNDDSGHTDLCACDWVLQDFKHILVSKRFLLVRYWMGR